MKKWIVLALLMAFEFHIKAQNPINPGIGLCDPQVRVYDDKVYLYATHDSSINNKGFVMNDWWIWSTSDLVHWKYESTLKPEDTYLKRPFRSCWATDAMSRDGKYYMYFSAGTTDVGVVISDSPTGPWKDPIGKPLLPKTLTTTLERDPGIVVDSLGNAYIVFGCMDYYIAKLNPDMVSLAETPKLINLDVKNGPYGIGKTDDKPFIHYYNGQFYLSWGCYYAMSTNVYGPYTYKGSIITKERTAACFQKPLTHDRHGSFFEYNHQWYFICNDKSYPGSNGHFRNSVVSYLHYKNNGEIDPIYLDAVGVGRYNALDSVIEAENYFNESFTSTKECVEGGFEVVGIRNGSALYYPNLFNLKPNTKISFRLSSPLNYKNGIIEIHENNPKGALLGMVKISKTKSWLDYKTISTTLHNKGGNNLNICLVFKGKEGEFLHFNWFKFSEGD